MVIEMAALGDSIEIRLVHILSSATGRPDLRPLLPPEWQKIMNTLEQYFVYMALDCDTDRAAEVYLNMKIYGATSTNNEDQYHAGFFDALADMVAVEHGLNVSELEPGVKSDAMPSKDRQQFERDMQESLRALEIN